MKVLHLLEGGEGIEKEEEFMWRGKEMKMRETGIDGKKSAENMEAEFLWRWWVMTPLMENA